MVSRECRGKETGNAKDGGQVKVGWLLGEGKGSREMGDLLPYRDFQARKSVIMEEEMRDPPPQVLVDLLLVLF